MLVSFSDESLEAGAQPLVHVAPVGDEAIERAVVAGGGRCVGLDEAEAVVWIRPTPERFPDPVPPQVRWVQLPAAGIEAWIEGGVIERSDATFTSARGAYGAHVAEHALGLLLMGAKDLHRWVTATTWQPHWTRVLDDAVVTVVGAGGIGRALIDMLVPLRARCVAVTRSGREVPGAHANVTSDGLDDWWEHSDYVVLAAPASPDTRHLVGRPELAAMPDHAWLVNVARGTLVDTDALVDALRSESIRGAALDVTDPEPLPDGHPLWELPGAVITPHVANPGPALWRRLAERVEGNVRRFAAGDPLLGEIDTGVGY